MEKILPVLKGLREFTLFLWCRFLEVLPSAWFMVSYSRRHTDENEKSDRIPQVPKVNIKWDHVIQSLVVALVVSIAGSVILLNRIDERQRHIEEHMTAVIVRVDNMCKLMQTSKERLTILEMYQDDRLMKEGHKNIKRYLRIPDDTINN
jgi:hypothetical protein